MTASAIPAYELVGNLANLQWFVVIGSVPFLLTASRDIAGPGSSHAATPRKLCRYGHLFLGLTLGLSAPALLIVMPVLLYRAKKAAPWLHGGLAASLALQISIFIHQQPGHRNFGWGPIHSTLVALGNQVVLAVILGQRHAFSLATKATGYSGIIAIVFVGLLLSWAAIVNQRNRRAMFGANYLILSSLFLSMVTRPQLLALLPSFDHMIRFGADRYFFCASCFFVYCLALAVDGFKLPPKSASLVLACLFILSGIVNFRIGPLSDMDWQHAAMRIDAWSRCRRESRSCPSVSEPVNPKGWLIELPATQKGAEASPKSVEDSGSLRKAHTFLEL